MNEIKMHVQSAPWYRGYELLIRYDLGPHHLIGKLIEPLVTGIEGNTRIEFEKIQDGTEVDPTIRLTYENAQILIDELWHCGLRPSNEVGNVGELRATQTHLEDMRKQNTKLLDKVLEDNNEQR